MVHVSNYLTALVNDRKCSCRICSAADQELPTGIWKFLQPEFRAIKAECLFMARNFRHREAGDGSGARSDPYRFGRPRRQLEQPLIAEFRHASDLGRLPRFKALVVELDHVGSVPEFVHSTFAA